ncbi:MAG: DUF502 domain-containing protein [Waddliaceae bacterium]
MKKSFVTGLVILLPLALTLAIVMFFINLFTGPFVGVVRGFLQRYDLFQKGFLFLSANQVQQYFSQLLILVFLFFITVLLGVLTRWVVVHYFIRLGDYVFHRIPFVRSIYKTSQDVIQTIFTSTTKSFKQVVLAPFPNPQTYSMGLLTGEHVSQIENLKGEKHVAVFVPTTPNPTSGFLMIFRSKDLIYLDMSVEDAFKYVISCGVILTPFQKVKESEESGE